jgi:hypothetical protein
MDAHMHTLSPTQQIPFNYIETDISRPENKEWFDLYCNDIPVVHINGVELARHRLREDALVQGLRYEATRKKCPLNF